MTNIIKENKKLIDNFIEEEFVKAENESLSKEEQKAHNLSLVKTIMRHICLTPFELFTMPVDKFERDKINEQIIQLKKKTRPINPLRHNADGSYNSHSLDPNYNHNYYEEKMKGVKVTCTCCGLELLKTNYAKHKKSKKCQHVAMCQAHNATPS